MQKPEPIETPVYDYYKCSDYIANLLGQKDLREYDGDPNQDFWFNYVMENNDVCNGCLVVLWCPPEELEDKLSWCAPIIEAFYKEFGPDTYYHACW